MNKIISIISIVILFFTGCNSKKEIPEKKLKKTKTQNVVKKEKYNDNNPIKLGIYKYDGNIPILTNEYTSSWNFENDISYFTIFYTQDYKLTDESFVTQYNRYKNNYKDINVKNGIMVEFNSGEKRITKTILNPKDIWDLFDYVEIYLYDDTYHQFDSWYSHTTEEEFNDNTIISTFKITSGARINEITSDITITAFSYDTLDDFDSNNIYRGNSYYKLILKRG